MAYLFTAFLLLSGGLLGAFCMFLWQYKRVLKDRLAYEQAKKKLLDLRKELRDMAVEQIRTCSDHVRQLYAARQEDVTRYIKGSDASLQLVNELMGHVNSMIQEVPDFPQSARQHVEQARAVADEMRRLLNEINFETLAELIAAMEASEAKALRSHNQLENQQEHINERT